jgi:hypothetical protein
VNQSPTAMKKLFLFSQIFTIFVTLICCFHIYFVFPPRRKKWGGFLNKKGAPV